MTQAPTRHAPGTADIEAAGRRAAAESAATIQAFYAPPGDQQPALAAPPTPEPPKRKPLNPMTEHQVEEGLFQRRHLFNLPDRDYWADMRSDPKEARRLLTHLDGKILDFDRCEVRIGAETVIDAIIRRTMNSITFHVTATTQVGTSIGEPPKSDSGKWAAWFGGPSRRWCVVDPKGRIMQANIHTEREAEFEAKHREIGARTV